jgi:ABC-type branched-subunit amino acid transport system ATPase component
MLEVKNLHSGYNKIEVLHDVNITVPDGKIVVVIGRNGAGKSTLEHHLWVGQDKIWQHPA